MNINELLLQKNITKYKLSKISGVSFTTISEITTNKSKIINCAAGTLYRLAKALNVSMEDLLAGSMEYRHSFENFKSNVCHSVKNMGDIKFIISMLDSNKIRELYLNRWYPECLYLLAMVDYLSRENGLPVCVDYNDIRSARLKKTIYPSGILAMCAALGSNAPKKESRNEAIPEFLQFNIVESEVRNVC